MTSELSGDALNRQLAEAMGWHVEGVNGITHTHGLVWAASQHGADVKVGFGAPPPFATSLDALRDGPERLLREAGGRQSHSEGRSLNWQEWEWDCPDSGIATRDGWNACEKGRMDEPVRARAALAALSALRSGEAVAGKGDRP